MLDLEVIGPLLFLGTLLCMPLMDASSSSSKPLQATYLADVCEGFNADESNTDKRAVQPVSDLTDSDFNRLYRSPPPVGYPPPPPFSNLQSPPPSYSPIGFSLQTPDSPFAIASDSVITDVTEPIDQCSVRPAASSSNQQRLFRAHTPDPDIYTSEKLLTMSLHRCRHFYSKNGCWYGDTCKFSHTLPFQSRPNAKARLCNALRRPSKEMATLNPPIGEAGPLIQALRQHNQAKSVVRFTR